MLFPWRMWYMKAVIVELGVLVVLAFFIYKALTPLQVHTQASPEQLQNACLSGYFATIKQVNYMHVIDATIYCEEKFK